MFSLCHVEAMLIRCYPCSTICTFPLKITIRCFRYALSYLWNQLLHSVNLILFTLLLVYLIRRISPHHSHHLRDSHHLSLPRPFTPNVKLNCFTNPFLRCLSDSFWTALTDLGLGPEYMDTCICLL